MHVEKTKRMLSSFLFIFFFWVKEDEFLEKYNEIWEKVKNIIKKEFDNEQAYSEKYLKAEIKSYNGKVNTSFPNNNVNVNF